MFIPANRRNENIFINLDVSTQHGILLCMVFAYSIKHILNTTTIDTIQFQKDFLVSYRHQKYTNPAKYFDFCYLDPIWYF